MCPVKAGPCSWPSSRFMPWDGVMALHLLVQASVAIRGF